MWSFPCNKPASLTTETEVGPSITPPPPLSLSPLSITRHTTLAHDCSWLRFLVFLAVVMAIPPPQTVPPLKAIGDIPCFTIRHRSLTQPRETVLFYLLVTATFVPDKTFWGLSASEWAAG